MSLSLHPSTSCYLSRWPTANLTRAFYQPYYAQCVAQCTDNIPTCWQLPDTRNILLLLHESLSGYYYNVDYLQLVDKYSMAQSTLRFRLFGMSWHSDVTRWDSCTMHLTSPLKYAFSVQRLLVFSASLLTQFGRWSRTLVNLLSYVLL